MCSNMAMMVIILVTKSTKFTFRVNVIPQSDFGVKVKV